jgi:hypothetical protein
MNYLLNAIFFSCFMAFIIGWFQGGSEERSPASVKIKTSTSYHQEQALKTLRNQGFDNQTN